MKSFLVLASFAFSLTGCGIPNIAGSGIDPEFSTDWEKIDHEQLEDFKKTNGRNSLFLNLNNSSWDSGAKVVFIKPKDCTYYESNTNQTFYQSCKWMAEIKDIRGTQLCVNVSGYRDYDGDLGYNLNEASCRWKDEING